MRFLTFDELTPSMDLDRLLVHLVTLGGATRRTSVDLWRRNSDVFADYIGVFAVERGRVLGQTFVKRLSYMFPDGPQVVSAIASVGTRPDRARSGVALRILEQVHRREREAGIRYATLWTNRSWGAHRLYERLGYRDVYAFPWAIRGPRPTKTPSAPSPEIGPGRTTELAALERLHELNARGRLGFVRRPGRSLRTAVATGEIAPKTDLVVARADGRPVGYALVQPTPARSICGEVVAGSTRIRRALVAEVERRADGVPLAFQHTPITDSPTLFRDRGYRFLLAGWYTLLAKEIDRTWSARAAVRKFSTTDRRFLCMAGDRF
jgi:GNAT superfamily N-acetyltransferase